MPSALKVVKLPSIMTKRGSELAWRRAAQSGLTEWGQIAQSEIRNVIVEGADTRGHKGRVWTGALLIGILAGPVEVSSRGARIVVAPSSREAVKAIVHEEGRRAGRTPPPKVAIRAWLTGSPKGMQLTTRALADAAADGFKGSRDTFLDGAEEGPFLQRIGFASVVARSIGRKGIPGLQMFEKASIVMVKKGPPIMQKHAAREFRR